MSSTATPDAHPGTYPALSRREVAGLLALVVVQFAVLHGPVWRRFADWDASILYSYATIPVAVAVALALKRRLRAVPWLLHTVELTGWKFLVTASLLLLLLASGQVTPGGAQGLFRPRPAASPAPRASPPGPTVRGDATLQGRVVSGGAPVANAELHLVSPAGPLEPPRETLTVTHSRAGFPPVVVAEVGQPIAFRTDDGRLHSVRARRPDGTAAMTLPVSPGGPSTFLFQRPEQELMLECTVHPTPEAQGRLTVLPRGSACRADAQGRFAADGLPAGEVTIRVLTPEGVATAHAVQAPADAVVVAP